jgi:hypothetical protein
MDVVLPICCLAKIKSAPGRSVAVGRDEPEPFVLDVVLEVGFVEGG